jgi:uncharacterized protein YjbI with pentapeptide repeats
LEKDNKNKNIVYCAYNQRYYDYQNKQYNTFQCDQIPLGNKGLCLFHDEDYMNDHHHPENKECVTKRIIRKIENSVFDNISLYCIGYHLPKIIIYGKFKQPVYFNKCKFQEIESGATFLSSAFFSYAVFSKNCFFSGSTFSERVNFYKTEFLSKSIFRNATFLSEANFSYAIFKDKTIFSGSTFSERVNFYNVIFSKRVNFYKTEFLSESQFSGSTFLSEASFINAIFSDKDPISFNSVIFKNASDIIFDVKDLSHVSFLDTNITEVRFSDKTSWGGDDNFQVIEEDWFEQDFKKPIEKRRVSLVVYCQYIGTSEKIMNSEENMMKLASFLSVRWKLSENIERINPRVLKTMK